MVEIPLERQSAVLSPHRRTDLDGIAKRPCSDRRDSRDAPRRAQRIRHRRAWERYHIPKNLTTAIAGEVGELAAVLQWATPDEDITPYRDQLEDEIADVLIYFVRLADVTDVDLIEAAKRKIARNETRYPPISSARRTR